MPALYHVLCICMWFDASAWAHRMRGTARGLRSLHACIHRLMQCDNLAPSMCMSADQLCCSVTAHGVRRVCLILLVKLHGQHELHTVPSQAILHATGPCRGMRGP